VSAPAAVGWRVASCGTVAGTLTVPGDKSISHRALMLGAIAHGETRIRGFLDGEDCLATAGALAALGVRIERPAPTEVHVHGAGAGALRAAAGPLDMGNAGTAMRLMMGLLAPQTFDATLIGDASLMRRPMERVAQPLRAMGARVDTHEGRPPVVIHGTPGIRGIEYTLPVASAQVKSALLLAGLAASGRTVLREPAPSRDHTERMLRAFGVQLEQRSGVISLEGGQALRATALEVPADFSSAAFFLVAGALAAEQPLRLTNIGVNPTRTGLLELLCLMGADIRVLPRGSTTLHNAEPVADIEVKAGPLRGITVPERLVPLAIDELPVFFIAAACAALRASLVAEWTAVAITASPWPSRWRRCGHAPRSRSWTSPTSRPASPGSRSARVRPGWDSRRSDEHRPDAAVPGLSDRHHRRPERLGQGHHQPRGRARSRLAPAR